MARESGYALLIRGFIKVDPADIDRVVTVGEAIKKARDPQEPDLAPLLALAVIDEQTVKPSTRMALTSAGAVAVLPDMPDLVPARQLHADA